MNSSRIFIGMPVYNGEDYIGAAIESVLRQTHRDFILLIQDNASTDSTLEIIKKFAIKDPRISFKVNPHNLGAAENFWSVAEANNSEYFLWFSCDDLMEPEFLEECLNILKFNPEVGMASTGFINFDNESQINFEIPIPLKIFGKINNYKIFEYLSLPEALGKANLIHSLFRRRIISDLLANYQFTLHSAWGGDMNLVLAALILGGGCSNSNRILFNKRLPKGFLAKPHRNFLQRYVDHAFPTELFFEYARTATEVLVLTNKPRLLAIKIYLRFFTVSLIKKIFHIKYKITHYYYYYLSKLQQSFWISYGKYKECLMSNAYNMKVSTKVFLSKCKQNSKEILKLCKYKIYLFTKIMLSKVKRFIWALFKK
jgi:glycosyltransferase involved in cell wall biosynthesis